MINLLATDLKEQYLYGRRNTILRRWAFALLLGLVGVGVVTTAGLFYMKQSIKTYSSQVTKTQASLEEQKIGEVQKDAQDITDSLKLAVDVLSREVLFSQLLKQIATVTPPNTVLTDLSISKTQGAIEIAAISSDYASATQLQVNLQDPENKIFSKADILNIACVPTPVDPKYPCTVTVRALFADNNPFLFINRGGSNANQ